jgi:D-alanyl-D-alanine carboxypeptidase
MPHIGWKLAAGIVVAMVVLGLLVPRLTRHVSPYVISAAREQVQWGSVQSETAGTLQSVLDEEVNALKVLGLQAFVRTADGRTWSGASGTVDLARKIPFKRDHVIRVGSVTKTLTAVMILKLVDEGQLALDDPLANWFPDFPRAGDITVRQLLNHSSGIPEFLDTSDVLMRSILTSTYWQPHEVLDIAAKREPYFAPGEGWRYSNTNYVLLGLIAEKLTGKTTAQLLHEQIIDPLGLRNTYFIPYEPAPARLVTGFDRDLSHFPGLLDITTDNTSWATAAFTSGALASTADDLGVLYQSLFAGNLLSPSAMKEMTTFVDASNPGFEQQDGYGLGLMRIDVDGHPLVGHVGEFMGSTSIAMYSPDEGYLIVVNSNLSFPDLVRVVARLQQWMK